VDAIYFCPLAPTIKDPTVIEDPMRKPGPGMLLAAARDHGLDLARSWMVGDTVSDMLAGRNAGCRSLLVATGYGAKVPPEAPGITARAPDLAAAAELILNDTLLNHEDTP
jgi:D-glycero-D-manno-heptose 1,7-bisphosphate phosphatase